MTDPDDLESRLQADGLRHQKRVLWAVAAMCVVFTLAAVPTIVAGGLDLTRAVLPLIAMTVVAATAAVLAQGGHLRTSFGLLSVAILATIFDAHAILRFGSTAPVHAPLLIVLASMLLPWRQVVAFGGFVAVAVVGMRVARGDDGGPWLDATFDLVTAPLLTTVLVALNRWRADRDEDALRAALKERRAAVRIAADAAEEALAASRQKSEFLARVSHELRTPINAILGYTELVQEEAPDLRDTTRSDLERVETSARDLLALVDDVLDLSRAESGHVVMHPERVDVAQLVADALDTVRPLLDRNRNTLQFTCPPLELDLDPQRVRQVLVNLLANAARFTTDGTVTVRVRPGDHETAFDVVDTGIGIRPERIGALFQPFVQAESDTAFRYGGTGLGLAICDRLVRSMGGRFEVVSTPGKGSRFTFRIPRQA